MTVKKVWQSRKKVIIGAAVLALGLAVFGIYTLTHQKAAVAVETIRENTVQRGNLSVSVEGDGQAQFVTKNLTFGVTGDVAAVLTRAGSKVKKGDVLANLDATSLNNAAQEAQANYELAAIRLQTAKYNQENNLLEAEKKVNDLEKDLAIMREFPELYAVVEINTAEANLAAAKRTLTTTKNSTSVRESELSLEQSARNLSQAQNNAAAARLLAPADGTILSVSIREGDSVGASSLAMVFSYDEVYIESKVQEYDIGDVKAGQTVRIQFDAIGNKTYRAEVSEIDLVPVSESGVSSYVVRSKVLNPDSRILPGMACSLAFIVEEVTDVLTIPARAVKLVDGRQVVEVYDAKRAIVVQEIETGFSDGTNVEVLSGLQAGDVVLTRSLSTTPTARSSSNSDSSRALGSSGGGMSSSGGTITIYGGPGPNR